MGWVNTPDGAEFKAYKEIGQAFCVELAKSVTGAQAEGLLGGFGEAAATVVDSDDDDGLSPTQPRRQYRALSA